MRLFVLVSLIAALAVPAAGIACDHNPGGSAAALTVQRTTLAVAHPAVRPKAKPKLHAALRAYYYR